MSSVYVHVQEIVRIGTDLLKVYSNFNYRTVHEDANTVLVEANFVCSNTLDPVVVAHRHVPQVQDRGPVLLTKHLLAIDKTPIALTSMTSQQPSRHA